MFLYMEAMHCFRHGIQSVFKSLIQKRIRSYFQYKHRLKLKTYLGYFSLCSSACITDQNTILLNKKERFAWALFQISFATLKKQK